jgi:hypothetical protein
MKSCILSEKSIVSTFANLCNLAILNTPQEECHYLTYQGIEQLLMQVAVHISRKYFYKRKKSKSLVQIVERLFKRMGLVREDKGIFG